MNHRFFKLAIFWIISLSTLMCSSDSNQQKPVDGTAQASDTSNKNEIFEQVDDSLGKSFDNKTEFNILSMVKGVSTASTDPDTTKCSSWVVTKAVLRRIIHNSKPISGTEWDLAYDHLRCTVTGHLSQG